MKRAVSVSLGSSSRDKRVVVKLKGEEIIVERTLTIGRKPLAPCQVKIDTSTQKETNDDLPPVSRALFPIIHTIYKPL